MINMWYQRARKLQKLKEEQAGKTNNK